MKKYIVARMICKIIGHKRIVVKLDWNDNHTHFHVETYCFRCNTLSWRKVEPILPTKKKDE